MLTLVGTDVHLWAVNLHATDLHYVGQWKLLSAAEQAQAKRFRSPGDRVRFVLTRAKLRELLASYTGEDPDRIFFKIGEHGKPELPISLGDVGFNVSHSRDLALFGFTRGREIGVDVE